MYLSQTTLEVDTTREFEYANPNGSKVLVYKTKPGAFDPLIHARRPSNQIVAIFDYAQYGRSANIYEITPKVKLALRELKS